MENFDDYALPGGLDGLTKAIHNQHTVNEKSSKDEVSKQKETEKETPQEREQAEVHSEKEVNQEQGKVEKKKTTSKKENAENAGSLSAKMTDGMSEIEKVLAYADAYSKEYRQGEKKKGNMIMIDEDLKLSLDKFKLAYSGEMKLSVKHLANAIIKMFFEDEKNKEAIKAQMKKL